MTVLKRQFITDAEGNAVGVILPVEEYRVVKEILEAGDQPPNNAEKIALMERAAHDVLFLNDLHETMGAFAEADDEWWEPKG